MLTDVRTLVLQGQYQSAIELFNRVPSQTPEDERFAGLALFNLGRHKEARQTLLQSVGRGHVEAKIELACLLRHLGDFRVATTLLSSINAHLLNSFDRCLYFFEASTIKNEAGQREEAIDMLEQAWLLSFEIPEGVNLQPGIAQALGGMYTEGGFDDRSAEHFDYAIQYGSPGRQANARLARARALVYSGRPDEAREEMKRVEQVLPDLPNLRPLFAYNLGILERSSGPLEKARRAFIQSSQEARALGHTNTEAYSELALAAVYTEEGALDLARRHLAGVRKHLQTDRIRLYFLLREGALLNALSDGQAIPSLEEALQGFEKCNLYREASWASLHLAEAFLRAGEPEKASRALSKAADQRHIVGSGSMFRIELRSLTLVQKFLEEVPEGHYNRILYDDFHSVRPQAPKSVFIQSMGHPRVLMDLTVARFELARTVEVLVYLLCHPHQKITAAVSHLFPDTDAKLAKNYFHQARYDIARAIPGLSVPFQKSDRTYALAGDNIDIVWDASELTGDLGSLTPQEFLARTDGLEGEFLPLVETEWAEEARQRIHWQIMRSGMAILEKSIPASITKECEQVIERLLKLEPFSETLAHYQLMCTLHLYGEAAANAQAEKVLGRFMAEFGEAPSSLRQWNGKRTRQGD